MSEGFKLEIVNPESSFLSKEGVTEVVVPAFEGDMGILKDHISIISFLKPGLVRIFDGSNEETYYVDDGIVEFKNNCLSILTSNTWLSNFFIVLKDLSPFKVSKVLTSEVIT